MGGGGVDWMRIEPRTGRESYQGLYINSNRVSIEPRTEHQPLSYAAPLVDLPIKMHVLRASAEKLKIIYDKVIIYYQYV